MFQFNLVLRPHSRFLLVYLSFSFKSPKISRFTISPSYVCHSVVLWERVQLRAGQTRPQTGVINNTNCVKINTHVEMHRHKLGGGLQKLDCTKRAGFLNSVFLSSSVKICNTFLPMFLISTLLYRSIQSNGNGK